MLIARDLAWALDPVAFAREALGFEPDPWQERVLRHNGRRLLLNCSRQAGKSTTAAVKALHGALFKPESLILLISPSQRQSSELFRKVADNMNRMENKPRLIEDNSLSCKLENGSRIVSLPSNEANVRGFSGATLVVEDEASRVPDELHNAIRPMLAVSNGQYIQMSTPFGRRGHFFEAWENGGASWDRISVKGSEVARITPEFLADERASIGDWWFRQEYECQFVDTTDQVFSYEHVMGMMSDDLKPLFKRPIFGGGFQ